MSNKNIPKWDDERVSTLKSIVGTSSPVSVELVTKAAGALNTTEKSIAAKLRNIGYAVESMAVTRSKAYTEDEEMEIKYFLESNPNKYTYKEIAESVLGGTRNAKQIQGKILSMELFDLVLPTPQEVVPKKYTEEEEAKLLGLLGNGSYIEDIAEKMGREVKSIRGKILALLKANPDIQMPKQRNKKSDDVVDPIVALGDLSKLTVKEISEATGKTARGVKTILTRRGISCSDYNGAKKAEKIAAQSAANA